MNTALVLVFLLYLLHFAVNCLNLVAPSLYAFTMAFENQNTTLYVDSNGNFAVRQCQEIPAPGHGELLIENQFSGINPAVISLFPNFT